jgi:uncharacterized protein
MTSTVRHTTIEEGTGRPLADRPIALTQYSRRGVLAVWAAAAAPMGVLSWVVAPAIADGGGIASLVRPLIACMTVGLTWQFVLALGLVGYEQRSLRWSRLKQALWLQSPRHPGTGRKGGRNWLVLIPLIVGFGLVHELAGLPIPADRDLGAFLENDAGRAFFDGAWGLYGLFVLMGLLNTVLGEELLFRGVLLPRMQGAFRDRDWVANGVLFGFYHLHVPWAIPGALLDTFLISRPSRRYRSALVGIAVHSAQTVVISSLVLGIVL